MNSQQNMKQQQQVKAKQPAPTQPSDASSPTDKSSFFGLWFGGGGAAPKSNREPDSRQSRLNDRSLSQPKPVKLEPVPSTLQVNSIPKEKEFEIELLGTLTAIY
jgi:hypothetical protein